MPRIVEEQPFADLSLVTSIEKVGMWPCPRAEIMPSFLFYSTFKIEGNYHGVIELLSSDSVRCKFDNEHSLSIEHQIADLCNSMRV